jgi:hypothetical protein
MACTAGAPDLLSRVVQRCVKAPYCTVKTEICPAPLESPRLLRRLKALKRWSHEEAGVRQSTLDTRIEILNADGKAVGRTRASRCCHTWQGWVYVAFVIDVFARCIDSERMAEAGIEPWVGNKGDSYEKGFTRLK